MSTPVTSAPRPNGVRVITRESAQLGLQGEHFERPPSPTARVTLAERWRTSGSRWGDLTASQVTAIRRKLEKGEVADWADVCEFWLSSDLDLASLYSTRMDRIIEREWEVVPNEFGDQRLASLAAEMCHELIARIENWNPALRELGHAIAVGFAAAERQWEYDRATRMFYVKKIMHRHGHRFRFGPHWDLRLYDRGQLGGADGYGEMLDRKCFIVHHHQEQAGYPNVGGVMLAGTYINAFARWIEKMRIGAVERYGQPIPVYECPPDTPEATREEAKEKLQDMSTDSAYVVEQPGKITLVSSSGGTGVSMHKETLDDYYRQRARLWSGSSDMADPGAHGTQGAVVERVDATSDPKTSSDLKNLAQTLHLSLLKDFVHFNAKRLGAAASQIPVPKLKAWKDESDMQNAPGPTMQGDPNRAPGMLPNGQPAPRIPEIRLARDHDPKAAASGEPGRVKLVIGRAPMRSQTRSTSLETKIARLLRGE